MTNPRFLALLALAFIGCGLVPACTPVHVHTGPAAQTAGDVRADDDGRFGAVAVKNASGSTITLASYTDGSDEVPIHGVERCGTDATDACKLEGAAHASGDTGISIWGVRRDANTAFTGVADGDRAPLQLGAGGALKIEDGGNSLTIDASSLPLPTGAATAANQSTLIGHVDGLETALAGTLNVALSNLTQSSSAAHSTSHNGIQGLTVRRDTPTASADSNGEYQPATTDDTGKQWVRLDETAQKNPYYAVTALDDIATNADTTSSAIDLRGYTEVWIDVYDHGDAVGEGDIYFDFALDSSAASADDRIPLPIYDLVSKGANCVAADGATKIDVTFQGDGPILWCILHLIQPPPHMWVRYDAASGGHASDGLTVRVRGRAF